MEIEFDSRDIDALEDMVEEMGGTRNVKMLIRLLRENSEVTILVEES